MTLPDATIGHLRSGSQRADDPGGRYELREEIGRGGMGVV